MWQSICTTAKGITEMFSLFRKQSDCISKCDVFIWTTDDNTKSAVESINHYPISKVEEQCNRARNGDNMVWNINNMYAFLHEKQRQKMIGTMSFRLYSMTSFDQLFCTSHWRNLLVKSGILKLEVVYSVGMIEEYSHQVQ